MLMNIARFAPNVWSKRCGCWDIVSARGMTCCCQLSCFRRLYCCPVTRASPGWRLPNMPKASRSIQCLNNIV